MSKVLKTGALAVGTAVLIIGALPILWLLIVYSGALDAVRETSQSGIWTHNYKLSPFIVVGMMFLLAIGSATVAARVSDKNGNRGKTSGFMPEHFSVREALTVAVCLVVIVVLAVVCYSAWRIVNG